MKIFVTSDAGSLTPMDKWEYRWVEANPKNDFELDKYGTDGWEAVSCAGQVYGSSMATQTIIWVLMKRKVLKAES